MPTPLSPDEIARFQALVKPAVVLLLMLRLDRPTGARELADLLGLDEHTVAKYLRILTRLNLVARSAYQCGYVLLGGRQLIFEAAETVKENQSPPTTDSVNFSIVNQDKAEAGGGAVFTSQPLGHPSPSASRNALVEALLQAGVGEPKRSQLCELPYLTPEAVRIWESQLKHDKGSRYSVGLLIHVLECDDPPPPANAYGHILSCDCSDCQRLKYLVCFYCHTYPCNCPDSRSLGGRG